jgi:hypothetical protein
MEKIDIVLQGPYTNFTDEIINSYLNLHFIDKIIVSCWDIDKKEEYQSDRVEFVRNCNYPSYSGVLNVNLQIVTSLEGIKKSQSNYVVKMRSDQKFTHQGIINMFNFFIKNKQNKKIFICGDFFAHLFHPRDHVFWGYKEDMINLFDIPFEINEKCKELGVNRNWATPYMHLFTRPETYIGAYYCSRFDERVKIMVENQEKYLYDGAPEWHYANKVSKYAMLKAFKSFPREGIDLIWPKNNVYGMYSGWYNPIDEVWDEEGH